MILRYRQWTIEDRYELAGDRIVPQPDYVTPQGRGTPPNAHAAIFTNLVVAGLHRPFQAVRGAGAKVNRMKANVPDLSVSCDPDERKHKALETPRLVCEVLSPRTRGTDTHVRAVTT